MLNPLDDYPVHQTPEPLAHVATGDRNAYDRYFFNGYDRHGELFFAAAMGLYPNRQVIDASFSVVRDGVQRAVFGSGRAPVDRTTTSVGPVRIEVIEPLRRLRVIVDGAEQGVTADLTFTARTVAVEEPRFTRHNGTRVVMDYTRLAQWGGWSGWIETGGERVDVSPGAVVGSRDRSWGIRGVGEPEGGAPGLAAPQFFWLWAPLNFDDACTHFDVQELADGRRWHQNGAIIPVIGEGDPTLDTGGTVEPMHDVDWSIDWAPGTRRARRASVTLTPWRADPVLIELEPLLTFQMMGIGYFNAEWSHGLWKGESATGGATWTLDDLDPADIRNFHVQQQVRATMGGKVGVGVLEQLVIGPHEPSGFAEFMDVAPG